MQFDQIDQFSTIVILGYGLEGRSSEQFLQKKFAKKSFRQVENVTDPIPKPNTDELFVISPGIDRHKLCQNIPFEQQTSNTEIFFANISEVERQKIIGISGSKGKSTTTKFCAELLANAGYQIKIGGNFGVPLLDLFDEIENLDFVVAELSSFQLEFLKISPKYAVFLNFFVGEHGDRHPAVETYLQIKSHLWNGAEKSAQYLIVPDQESARVAKYCHSRVNVFLSYTLPEDHFAPDSIFRAEHFRRNFGAIAALSKIIAVPDAEGLLKKTAQNFVGLPHRLELFSEKDGLKFYDDSISTNPEASVAAVKFFGEKLGAIILGGKEGKTYQEVFETIMDVAPQTYIWLPDSANTTDIEAVAKANNFPENQKIRGKNFTEVLTKGLPLIKNSTVVLSPGAKSFDNFENFKARGKAWKQAVKSV